MVEYQKIDSKKTYIDFKRPFIEKSENAMDFEGGKKYLTYMSYYLGKGTATKTSSVKGDKSGTKPKFVEIQI